ncbi:MAG: ATP-binding protein [Deinococcales bacterium]
MNGSNALNDPQELRAVEVFSDLEEGQLAWLAGRARLVSVGAGEVLFPEGAPTDVMIALLEGEVQMRREKGEPDGPVVVRSAGQITGMLPFSRLTHSPVTARATVPTRAAFFHVDLFPEMLQRIPELQLRLASIMVDRSREFTRHDEQREKLISLGKLSAGLAHELNNPAAAILSRTEELARRVQQLSDVARERLGGTDSGGSLASVTALAASKRGLPIPDLDPLAGSEAEESLAAWLEVRGIGEAWLAAETFVSAGLSEGDLEEATGALPDALRPSTLRWLEADLASRRLVDDIAEAAHRITELISTVKAYSNMDRAPTRSEIEVHEGIRSTLTMLAHKLRSKGVAVTTELDPALPRVTGNAGELNQVWTNLIDNAIDAVDPGGAIVIRTSSTDAGVVVQVIDDGAGVPAEVRNHIFEPFFTTKGVGEGTGLGLDIVRRIVRSHGGDVHVESVPGRTCFEVRLPASVGDGEDPP